MKNRVNGETYVIPCDDSAAPVEVLKLKIISRLGKTGKESEHGASHLVLAGSEAILNDKDAISDVLQDGDFISLICESLTPLHWSIVNVIFPSGKDVDRSDSHASEDISTLPRYESYPMANLEKALLQ